MDDYSQPEILPPAWINKDPSELAESRIFIFSCFVAGIIGILTIVYTAYQWRRKQQFKFSESYNKKKEGSKIFYRKHGKQ
ncbi:putative diacylglycerol kinase (ATP) [Helianthus annuus]|nr:putative diacylglycerol kinase (ATP) [Helianthus annuus]